MIRELESYQDEFELVKETINTCSDMIRSFTELAEYPDDTVGQVYKASFEPLYQMMNILTEKALWLQCQIRELDTLPF